jgi:magnesium transporter
VAIRPTWTVEEALAHIRARGRDSETINRIFVVDEGWHLLDDIELRRFILADPAALVADIMDHTVVSIQASADREEAVALIRRYDQFVLPVVDSDGVLVGIVTVDDVLDVQEAEATEDFHLAASVVLVFMNVLSGAGILVFEETLAATLALAFFLPLLIGSGGNAGSQSATLMIRALAVGDVRASDWLHLLGRELLVALAMGVTMAVAASSVAYFRAPEVMVVVALTMSIVVVVGSLIGMSLPFILTRLGWDPATASAPLVTSLSDITGVLIYFSIATWLLGT